jgi:poly(3-hydroxyalkanoate) synthetase
LNKYRLIGRSFLNDKSYGSIFSLNYDGIIGKYNPEKGIEDFTDVVRKKIIEIKKISNNNEIILLGHSMGGIISGYFYK